MLFFVVANIFLLGFVHETVSTPCIGKVAECGSSSVSEFSETMESSASMASSQYSKSSSSMTSMSSGSSCSSFDESYWLSIFEKCSFISEMERKCYLKWMAMFPGDCLTYYKNIAEYFSLQEAISSDIILDYTLLQTDILAAYEFFTSNNIYSMDVELATKTAIFEEYKSKLVKTLKCLGPSSPLYELLNYSLETDITSLACTIGLMNSIIKSQETYFSSSSTRSVESTSVTASSTSVKSTSASETAVSSTSVDVSQYETIFKTANIQMAESSVYLSYLSKLSSDKMCLFTDLIDFFNKDTQVLTTEMILDFTSFNSEIQSLYEMLVTKQFFIENADWLAQKAILTEMKSKLSSVVGYISKNCSMYYALQYCLEQDITYLPMFIGLNYYLLQQQSSYFMMSSSSSTSVTQTSSSSSCGCSSVCV